jgi:hypothetical protein
MLEVRVSGARNGGNSLDKLSSREDWAESLNGLDIPSSEERGTMVGVELGPYNRRQDEASDE